STATPQTPQRKYRRQRQMLKRHRGEILKEKGSVNKRGRAERKQVLALAQSRQMDAILVTELSRGGRSTLDLLNTLRELENWKVSGIAMNGMAFDLSAPYGRMLATFLSGLAEFERDLISGRVK
ncbi:recombinase family protein, partial [Klebsiella pneumoniae]|uniref:recombinase family protein n=1 Tax=Klebsiella pneumoniae TaxID=573 RepID=UPI001F4B4C7A